MQLRCTMEQGKEKIYALNDESFKVRKGEFISVVGASGTGKSTLLHTLGCVDKQTSGSVTIDGIDTSTLNENALTIFRRRQIGLVYQLNLFSILLAVILVVLIVITQLIALRYESRKSEIMSDIRSY